MCKFTYSTTNSPAYRSEAMVWSLRCKGQEVLLNMWWHFLPEELTLDDFAQLRRDDCSPSEAHTHAFLMPNSHVVFLLEVRLKCTFSINGSTQNIVAYRYRQSFNFRIEFLKGSSGYQIGNRPCLHTWRNCDFDAYPLQKRTEFGILLSMQVLQTPDVFEFEPSSHNINQVCLMVVTGDERHA